MSDATRLRALMERAALPWEATEDRPDDDSDDEDAEWFACVLSHHPDTDDRDTVAVVTTGHGIEIDRAHAALIAEAVNALPTLLDAAEERDALRARVAELENELTRLRWGIVANAGRTSRGRMVRWAWVRDAVGCGSTRAAEMCVAAGFDPDEECGIEPDEDEDSAEVPRGE